VPLPQVIENLESSASTAAWILVVAIVVPVVVVFLIILAIVVFCVSAFCLSISCVSHPSCLNLSRRAVHYSKSCVSGNLLQTCMLLAQMRRRRAASTPKAGAAPVVPAVAEPFTETRRRTSAAGGLVAEAVPGAPEATIQPARASASGGDKANNV